MFGLSIHVPRNAWLLNCCVSPQSEIARVRVDRSLIGAPSEFRHIGHLGTGDLDAAEDEKALGALLRSKGGPDFALQVPHGLRAADRPIGGPEESRQRRTSSKAEEEKGKADDQVLPVPTQPELAVRLISVPTGGLTEMG